MFWVSYGIIDVKSYAFLDHVLEEHEKELDAIVAYEKAKSYLTEKESISAFKGMKFFRDVRNNSTHRLLVKEDYINE